MTEMEYRKDAFITKYRAQIPVSKLRIMFDRADNSGTMMLGTINKLAEIQVQAWLEAKRHYNGTYRRRK